MGPTLRLEILSGPERGRTAALSGIAILGRDPACALVVQDESVSREHAVIRPDDERFVLEDLDSRSGTFVNEQRSRRSVLEDGDVIRLGSVQLRVGISGPALQGEVPPERVTMVSRPHQPTTRLTVDALEFRLRARDLGPPEPGQTASYTGGGEAAADPVGRLEQLCEISIAMATIHDPERLARETAERVFRMFPQVRRFGLFEIEEDRAAEERYLRPRLVIDRSRARSGGAVEISQTVLTAAIRGRQAILSEDVSLDPRFQTSQSLSEAGICSMICAPLCLGERTLGALYLDATDPARLFDEVALRLVTGIAAILAAARDNARLFARVQEETVRRASLERYFSAPLVERIMRGEVPLARQGRLASGTILFVDIRGFTRLTDTTPPPTLVSALNAYFAAMQRIIFRSGGTVERFGGDSILAYWGVVEQDPQGPAHAVAAALSMLAELFRVNPELEAQGLPALRIAIGLNSGDVIVGDVGSPERYEFTILGDAINLARRFESLAGPWELLAGAATVQALGASALHVPLPPTTVKGKDRAVAVSALYGLRLDPGPEGQLRFALALEASLDVRQGPEIVLVRGLEVSAEETTLLVLSQARARPGTQARLALRLPRAQSSLTVHGEVGLAGGLADTAISPGSRGPALQELRVDVRNAKELLEQLGVVAR